MPERFGPDALGFLLAGYLQKYCRGADRARAQGRIARDLRALGIACDARAVRDACAALRLAGCPVGTGTRGVFVCESRRDFRVGYRNLYARLRSQAKGCRAFRETYRRAVSGQAGFDFAPSLDAFWQVESVPLLADAGGARP